MSALSTACHYWRSVSQLHENESLIRFAQTITGRVLVCALAAGLLFLFEHTAILICSIALVSVIPEWRRIILSLRFFSVSSVGSGLRRLVVAIPLGLAFLAAKNFGKLPPVVRRRPQVLLHVALWSVFALVWLTPELEGYARKTLLALAAAGPTVIWRAGYMMMSGKRGSAAKTNVFDHLFYVWPVHTVGSVPYGKGHDYFSRHEAASDSAFARAQLAGLKLLFLAALWRLIQAYISGYLEMSPASKWLDWPAAYSTLLPLEEVVRGGDSFSLPVRWLTLALELIRMTLAVAVAGHIVVGFFRLCGFNIARNTYKPLLADSIVDFWHRFFHYFKELLVDFFFFPFYLKRFKNRPRLRLFAAVFSAAFFGNMYFHFMMNEEALIEMQFSQIGAFLGPRTIYCTMLAVGVAVSMWRQQKRRGRPMEGSPLKLRLLWIRRVAGVWFFYAMIHIWNLPALDLTITERNKFFLSLFGIIL